MAYFKLAVVVRDNGNLKKVYDETEYKTIQSAVKSAVKMAIKYDTMVQMAKFMANGEEKHYMVKKTGAYDTSWSYEF